MALPMIRCCYIAHVQSFMLLLLLLSWGTVDADLYPFTSQTDQLLSQGDEESATVSVNTMFFGNDISTNITADNAEELITNLTYLLESDTEADRTSENLAIVSHLLSNITRLIENEEFNATSDLVNNFVSILDSISRWPESSLENHSSEIVKAFEVISEDLVSQGNLEKHLRIVEDEIELKVLCHDVMLLSREGNQFSPTLFGEVDSARSTSMNNIFLPPAVFENTTVTKAHTVFGFYATSALFPLRIDEEVTENSLHKAIGSAVIAANIAGQNVSKLTEPILITFKIKRENWSNPVCVSWNFSEAGNGNWSTRGCMLMSKDVDSGVVACHCNHLTNFGVLVDINARKSPKENKNKPLRVFSIVGSILSMLGIIPTIYTLLRFSTLRKRDATKFHVQLCIAIFCMLFFFLVGIDCTNNEIGCTIWSLLIQYFSMASVAWMGAEALLMFKKLIIVFGVINTKHIIIISIIAWSIPTPFLIIALCTLGSGENFLISKGNFCFISHIGVFLGLFLVPILVVMVINAVVFLMVMRVLIKHSKRKLEDSDTKTRVKGILRLLLSMFLIMILFGFHWLFGALTIAKASLTFQWLFVTFSTLQGFLLFIFLIIVGADTSTELSDVVNRAQEEESCYPFLMRINTTKSQSLSLPYDMSVSQEDTTLSMSHSTVSPNCSKFDPNPSTLDRESSSVFTSGHNDDVRDSECADSSRNTYNDGENGEKVELSEVPLHVLKRKLITSHSHKVSGYPGAAYSLSNQEQLHEDRKLSPDSATIKSPANGDSPLSNEKTQ